MVCVSLHSPLDLEMNRTFTVQVGSEANWVGSHYWSALEHHSEMSQREADSLYNETSRGEYNPRTFIVDTVESFGPSPVEEAPAEQGEGFSVTRIEMEAPVEVHPFRKAVLMGAPAPAVDYSSFNYWTDFWEPPALPVHRLILPQAETPTEHHNRYWFEGKRLSTESLDDTDVRKLIEETDASVDLVRTLATMNNGLSSYAIHLTDYLRTAYPKSTSLALMSSLPDPEHLSHDHAIPYLINLCEFVVSRNSEDRCLYIVPPHRTEPRIETSAAEAVWLDCVSRRPLGLMDDFRVESPYLSVDGHSLFSPTYPSGHGTIDPKSRENPFKKNYANPLPITVKSDVIAGTYAPLSLLPVLEAGVSVLTRFAREFRAVYEPYNDRIEKDDLAETIEGVRAMVNDLRGQIEEE